MAAKQEPYEGEVRVFRVLSDSKGKGSKSLISTELREGKSKRRDRE
jgi:hypothetical protein